MIGFQKGLFSWFFEVFLKYKRRIWPRWDSLHLVMFMGCFSRVRCISGAEGNCQEFVISHALLIVEVMKLKAPTKVKIFGWRTLKGRLHTQLLFYILKSMSTLHAFWCLQWGNWWAPFYMSLCSCGMNEDNGFLGKLMITILSRECLNLLSLCAKKWL